MTEEDMEIASRGEKSVGLKKKDVKNQARWRVGVGEIAGRVG